MLKSEVGRQKVMVQSESTFSHMEGENEGVNVYTRIEAAAFNMQAASYSGHKLNYDKAHTKYTKEVKAATTIKADPLKTDLSEARGRLRAAIEYGQNEEAEFFRNEIKDLTKK